MSRKYNISTLKAFVLPHLPKNFYQSRSGQLCFWTTDRTDKSRNVKSDHSPSRGLSEWLQRAAAERQPSLPWPQWSLLYQWPVTAVTLHDRPPHDVSDTQQECFGDSHVCGVQLTQAGHSCFWMVYTYTWDLLCSLALAGMGGQHRCSCVSASSRLTGYVLMAVAEEQEQSKWQHASSPGVQASNRHGHCCCIHLAKARCKSAPNSRAGEVEFTSLLKLQNHMAKDHVG